MATTTHVQNQPTQGSASGTSIAPLVSRAVIVKNWLVECYASAPHPDKVHIMTHFESCIPALLEKLA